MVSQIPDAIRSALAGRRGATGPFAVGGAAASAPLRRGDVRVISPPCSERGAGSRLGVVLSVDRSDEFADVVLIHSAVELATSIDGVVPAELTGAPYDLVVETDLRGTVWTFQLGRSVGHLDEPTLEALSCIARDEEPPADAAAATRVWRGSPLLGESDERWQFKANEGTAFRSLARECTSVLIEGGSMWTLDPELIRNGQLDAHDDPDVIEALWEWRSTRMSRPLTIADETLREMTVTTAVGAPAARGDIGLELSVLAWDLAADVVTRGRSAFEGGLATPRRLLTTQRLLRASHARYEEVRTLGRVSS